MIARKLYDVVLSSEMKGLKGYGIRERGDQELRALLHHDDNLCPANVSLEPEISSYDMRCKMMWTVRLGLSWQIRSMRLQCDLSHPSGICHCDLIFVGFQAIPFDPCSTEAPRRPHYHMLPLGRHVLRWTAPSCSRTLHLLRPPFPSRRDSHPPLRQSRSNASICISPVSYRQRQRVGWL